MKGLSTKNLNNRSTSKCSFCRNPEHQVSKCPHVPIIWASLSKGIVPLEYMKNIDTNPNPVGSGTRTHYASTQWRSPLTFLYTRGENWGDLFKQTSRANDRYVSAQKKAKEKKNTKNKKALQTCGFCAKKGHTRRTCGHISKLKTELAEANRNFRKQFYEEYVVQRGLSTGCIIEFDLQIAQGYQEPTLNKTITTIITELNWDTINLFSTFTKDQLTYSRNIHIDSGYDRLNNILKFIRSDVLMKMPFNTTKYPDWNLGWHYRNEPHVAIPLPVGKPATQYDVMSYERQERIGYNSPTVSNIVVVSRAPQVLSSDWVDGYSDQMSVIFKKFNKEELDFLGITEHIKEWANTSISAE